MKRKTEEEVQNEVVEYYKDLENEPTMRDVFYEWVKQKLKFGEFQKQTYERYEADFLRFFNGTEFENRKIRYITEYELEDFIKTTICDNGLTSKAWSNIRTLLYGMFKYAKKRGFTTISITSFIGDLDLSRKSFTHKRKSDEEMVFTAKEMDLLVKYLFSKPTLGNLGLLLEAYTGMRVGEVVALKWEDVGENSIYVHRTQIRYHGEDGEVYETRDTPKTEAGIRDIVIVDGLRKVLKQLRATNPFTEHIFEKKGKPLTKHALEMCLYRACDKVGIPRRSTHALRRTYATRLMNAKLDDTVVTNQMGHTDIETTRKHYYFNDKDFETMSELIGKAINY